MEQELRSKARHYNRILSQIDEVYHEIALRQGYSDSAMNVLYTLADNDGACLLSALVRQSGNNKQTVNSALRKLERDEIVYLEAAGGRAKRVCVTQKGAALLHETVERILAMENRIYASWTEEEWERYIGLTERYLQQLRQETKELRETK